MTRRTPRRTFCIATLLLMSAGVAHADPHADPDGERESLAHIAHELRRLQVQVAQAARSADTSARVTFRYDWLEKDLELVLRGVTDHLDAPRQPRPVPPLAGDYRR